MITSSHNPKINRIRQLLTRRKIRDGQKAFVVEGVRLLEEALQADWTPSSVLYSDILSQRGEKMLHELLDLQVDCEAVRAEILNQLSDTETSQGILAVFDWRELSLPENLDFILIADGVRDPGNMGSILRAALAAGVQATFVTPGTTEVFSPKVLRAGMGAQFRLPVHSASWEEIDRVLSLQGDQKPHLYLSSSYASSSCWEVDFCRPMALLIGNEADGASKEAFEHPHTAIKIPMPGGSESLNAAIAAGILLFEVVRQRRNVHPNISDCTK